jgi:hypothetical protein
VPAATGAGKISLPVMQGRSIMAQLMAGLSSALTRLTPQGAL